jgi:hypothetical protein
MATQLANDKEAIVLPSVSDKMLWIASCWLFSPISFDHFIRSPILMLTSIDLKTVESKVLLHNAWFVFYVFINYSSAF